MTNSEQVDYQAMLLAYQVMLRNLENTLFAPEQSMYKMIEVRCFETMLDVQVELFNHDDQATFEILHAAKDDVDILSIIECLGGLSNLSEAVEQALKGGE